MTQDNLLYVVHQANLSIAVCRLGRLVFRMAVLQSQAIPRPATLCVCGKWFAGVCRCRGGDVLLRMDDWVPGCSLDQTLGSCVGFGLAKTWGFSLLSAEPSFRTDNPFPYYEVFYRIRLESIFSSSSIVRKGIQLEDNKSCTEQICLKDIFSIVLSKFSGAKNPRLPLARQSSLLTWAPAMLGE